MTDEQRRRLPLGAGGADAEDEDRRAARYRRPAAPRRSLSVYFPPEQLETLDVFTRQFIGAHARVSMSEVIQQALALALEEHAEDLEQRLLRASARARGRG